MCLDIPHSDGLKPKVKKEMSMFIQPVASGMSTTHQNLPHGQSCRSSVARLWTGSLTQEHERIITK